MRPKYSIVLPTLNGGRTLSVTLPEMLRIDRDDVEWVVSENHSDDDTWDVLREIVADDDRLRLVRPRERLPLGKHLEFAYQQASGKWLSHIGDDDHLLPWRFELLDQVLEDAGPECSLVRGEYLRYSWPEYPEPEAANSLDPATFERHVQVVPGKKLAAELLNQSHVHGGGSWAVRSDVVQAVRRRCGYFASPQHVEFFAMRAAAAISPIVAKLGLPLFVLGRHNKSSGTQYFLPKDRRQKQSWDWSFEDPDSYRQSPFNWKSYSTLSLDAALAVQSAFKDELLDVAIDWRSWTRTIHSEMMRLVRYRQLPLAARQDFLSAVARAKLGSALYWQWRSLRQSWCGRDPAAFPISSKIIVEEDRVVLPGRFRGADSGFQSIVEVPGWLKGVSAGAITDFSPSQTTCSLH